jgi:hypothetical protein
MTLLRLLVLPLLLLIWFYDLYEYLASALRCDTQ